MDALSRRINDLFAKENWAGARKLVLAELKKDPDDHWLLERLSTTYYEERNYQKALQHIQRANELAPPCPLVRWTLANTLDMLGQTNAALGVYASILQAAVDKGIEGLAEEECSEGVRWLESLLADCLYRMGGCFEKLERKDLALKHYRKFMEWLTLGVKSIYSRKEVQDRIRRLTTPYGDVLENDLQVMTRDLALA